MVLESPGTGLVFRDLPDPSPGPGEVLVEIAACGVCRTDLHIRDGDLTNPKLPLVPGHEIVGRVAGFGEGVTGFTRGQRVGVPWLGRTCGRCRFCRSGKENLCDAAQFTGYQIDGGYAALTVADHRYCFPIPDSYMSGAAAPLLCAGLIGFRSLRMAGGAESLGLWGFGAAAHIVAQIAVKEGRQVFAFTRPGDAAAQEFALSLGAAWAGDSTAAPPRRLDASILFAPVGSLVPLALRATVKGGTVVCGGIHMTDIPSFPYSLLWEERSIVSVANLTRQDGLDFFSLASRMNIHTSIKTFPLEAANEALEELALGRFQGAAVLEI